MGLNLFQCHSVVAKYISPVPIEIKMFKNKEIFWIFLMYFIQHCFIYRPSDSTMAEDAEIEPKTVSTLTFTVISPNYSAKSNPQ